MGGYHYYGSTQNTSQQFLSSWKRISVNEINLKWVQLKVILVNLREIENIEYIKFDTRDDAVRSATPSHIGAMKKPAFPL